jgi:signal transduction histidine kinase
LTGQARKWSDHPRACDLRVEFPPDCSLWVEAQEPLLGQLVDVLVENAFKYSESGTPITLRLWTEESKVCLAVEDQGGGIAREDLPHVFEPFYRSLNARRNGIGGVGLGLAIAERIAAALGGSLSVRSEPGKGSCFMLRLPLAAMPTPAQDCSGVDSPPQPQDAASGCRR